MILVNSAHPGGGCAASGDDIQGSNRQLGYLEKLDGGASEARGNRGQDDGEPEQALGLHRVPGYANLYSGGRPERAHRRVNQLIHLIPAVIVGAPDVAAAPALVPFLLDFEADAVGELAGKDGFVKSESYSAGTLSVSTAAPLAGTKSVYATTQAGNRTIYHRSFEVPLTLGMGYMVALKSKVNTPSFGIQSWVSVAALSGADDGVSAPANDASAAWGLIFTNGAPAPKFLTVRLAAGTTNVAVNFSTVKSLLIRVDAAGLADVLVDGAPVVSGAVVAANHPITRLVVMALTSGSLSEFAGLDDIQLAP